MDNICPYLGMIDDPKTSTLFPDSCNACFRAAPPQPVVIIHQRNYCLGELHSQCEGFVNGWQDGFPRSLRNKNCRKAAGFWKNVFAKLPPAGIIGGGLLAVLVLLGVFLAIANLGPTPAATLEGGISAGEVVRTATEQAATPTQTPAATFTSTAIPEPTSTPTPDFTPTQTPGPALKTPFGDPDFQLLIHEVQDQETVTSIANQYNTTVDVLWILNGLARRTIQVGDPIIVSEGHTDTQGLPQLQAIYLAAGTTLSDLASAYNAASSDLRRWNGLGDAEWIEGDRWLVVPLAVETEG